MRSDEEKKLSEQDLEKQTLLAKHGVDVSLLTNNVMSLIDELLSDKRSLRIEKTIYSQQIRDIIRDKDRIDAHTGLPNRIQFMIDCKEIKNRTASILHINDMQIINDAHGKRVWDIIIKVIAGELKKYMDAFSAEYGIRVYKIEWTSFLIVYDKPVTKDFIDDQYSRLIAMEYKHNNEKIRLGFSLWIVFDSDNAESMIRDSEHALYQSKMTHMAEVYNTAMDTTNESREILRMNSYVERAFQEDLFLVYFQPIVWINDATNVPYQKYEALVRMRNPDNLDQILTPADFLGSVASLKRDKDLTLVVLQKVCDAMNQFPGQFSINLTQDDFSSDGRAQEIIDILSKYHVDPGRLRCELVESISAITLVMRKNMNILVENNIGLSLDDMGEWNNSLGRVDEVDITEVKFDKKLIKGICHDSKKQETLQAFIDLAHTKNKRVIIEWVESIEEVNLLRSMRADFLQWYYFAKPAPIEELYKKIKLNK